MEYYRDCWKLRERPDRKLKVIVVGAGVAGLTVGIALAQSGHDVEILEQSKDISEVGAGIQMAPNNMRIYGRLGVLPEIIKHCNFMDKLSLRRWQSDEVLGAAPLMPVVAETYGAPLGVIHRGDLQTVLLRFAKSEGVAIKADQRVLRCSDDFEARVQLHTGEWLTADLIIAADGIKSTIRRQIAKHKMHDERAISTGDAAYRVLIPKEKLENEEDLKLLSENVAIRWMGPGSHIMAYPIKNNTLYNMVLLHPDQQDLFHDAKGASWTRLGDKNEMLAYYKDWCPQVRRLLSYVPEGAVQEWSLRSHRPLPSWVENKVVLMGDACHPMLPYVAQGAAQAIEDAGVLQCVLAMSSTDIPLALQVYQEVRKPRAEVIQQSAVTTQRALHLPDGLAQEERDNVIRATARGLGSGRNPDLMSDLMFQEYMWATDVMRDTVVRWLEYRARVLARPLPVLTPRVPPRARVPGMKQRVLGMRERKPRVIKALRRHGAVAA